MNDRFEQLDSLIADLLDDQLDAAGRQALGQLLRDDAEARRHYTEFIATQSMICRAVHRRVQGKNSKLEIRNSNFRLRRTTSTGSSSVSSFGFRVSSFVVAAAALIALAVTAWFLLSPEPRTLNPEPSAAIRSVAMLSDVSADAVFADSPSGDAPMNPGADLPAGPIRLTAGKAQIMFVSTAVVDLTGPCEFVMTGPNRGRLTAGSLEAYVPDRARGFTVDLPGGAKVVDLGTRFVAAIGAEGEFEVYVIDGTVEIAPLDEATSSTRSIRLAAGGAARGGAGRLDGIDAQASRLLRGYVRRAGQAVLVRYHDGTPNPAPIKQAAYISAADTAFRGESWRRDWGSAGRTPAGPLAGSSAGSYWRLFRAVGTPVIPTPKTAHVGFTVTYTGTRQLKLDTLRFDWAVATSNGGGGILMRWTAFASINGGAFTTVDSEPLAGLDSGVSNGWSAVTTAAADFSALPVLLPGDSIEIRVAVADNSGGNSKAVFIQGIRLDGAETPISSPIPADTTRHEAPP